jgi:hypothetical protein
VATNSGSDSVAGTSVGGTGFGFGRAGSFNPRSGLMRTMLAVVMGFFRALGRNLSPLVVDSGKRALGITSALLDL